MVEESSRKTYATFQGYSDIQILVRCYFFSLLIPFIYFQFLPWCLWLSGQKFYISGMDPNEPIYAVIFAPIIETLIFFFIPLEIFRVISLPRWFSYALIIFCFEGLHDQRAFFEHPIMWMTAYMFIVAYEAGRTRSFFTRFSFVFLYMKLTTCRVSCYILHFIQIRFERTLFSKRVKLQKPRKL